MRLDVTHYNTLGVLGSVLGQEEQLVAEAPIAAASYQEVWDRLNSTCVRMIGADECVKLLGYSPFVCPPPRGRPMTQSALFWLGFGLFGGMVVGKLFQ